MKENVPLFYAVKNVYSFNKTDLNGKTNNIQTSQKSFKPLSQNQLGGKQLWGPDVQG